MEKLGDQGQFIAVEVQGPELLGTEPILNQVPRQGSDLLLILVIFPAQLRPQPSNRVDRRKEAAQAIVVALRPRLKA
jgi:hypothetical protein